MDNSRVDMTTGSTIDYDAMTQDALRGVVRVVLNQVAKTGLPGEHHFYVAFNTQAPGVVLSRRLKEKYPDEMMIVLQHRFWDLAATDEGFEVKLTFDGIPERLCVPFSALRVFHDPSVRFTLQFGENALGDDAQDGAGRRRRDGSDAGRAGDRRGRSRGRTRIDGLVDSSRDDSAGDVPQAPPSPPVSAPTVFAPRAVEPKRSAAAPGAAAGPAPDEQTPAAEPGQKSGGAKVFSLDQFRKK